MRLVDEAEEVVGEVVEQAVGRGARLLAEQDARVVLDTAAVAHLAQHLHVVLRALAQAVRLEDLAVLLEPGAALVQLAPDLDERALDGRVVGDEVRRRVDGHVRRLLEDLAAHRVEADDLLDLVAPELDADGGVLGGGPDLDRVAAHAELAARGLEVVARVLDVDELAQHLVAVHGLADLQQHHLLEVVLGRAEAVDAADAGDDDDVAPQEQRSRGGVAQAVDLVVDRRVLLDVEVLRRDVGLRLVVVVVADEVLDRVVRQELAELVAELGRQRLVVGDDQCRLAATFSMTLAIVKVLPEPVTPRSVW